MFVSMDNLFFLAKIKKTLANYWLSDRLTKFCKAKWQLTYKKTSHYSLSDPSEERREESLKLPMICIITFCSVY